jgi:hypothetical protein
VHEATDAQRPSAPVVRRSTSPPIHKISELRRDLHDRLSCDLGARVRAPPSGSWTVPMTSPANRHVPTRTIAVPCAAARHRLRLALDVVLPRTHVWLEAPRLRVHPAKPKVGLRTIEAWWRSLKHHSLLPHPTASRRSGAWRRPQPCAAAFGLRRPDAGRAVLRNRGHDPGGTASRADAVRPTRLQANRSVSCDTCPALEATV